MSDKRPWQQSPDAQEFTPPKSDPIQDDKFKSYEERDNTPLQTVDLRYINGDAEAITYHFVDRYIRRGQGTVILRLGQEAIVIEGINLKPLYESLRKNTCAWIMEHRVEFTKSVPENMTIVSSIQILPSDQAIQR